MSNSDVTQVMRRDGMVLAGIGVLTLIALVGFASWMAEGWSVILLALVSVWVGIASLFSP